MVDAPTRGLIKVSCACGKALTFRRENAGKKARCPHCKAVVNIPAAGLPLKVVACKEHPDARRVAACMICSAPMCSLCRDERGYYCSDPCQAKSRELKEGQAQSEAERVETEQAVATGSRAFRWTVRGLASAAVVAVVWVAAHFVFSTRGEVAWQHADGQPAALVEHDGALVAVMNDGRVIKFDPEEGTPLAELKLGGEPGWGDTSADGGVLVVSLNDATVGVSLSQMKEVWRLDGRAMEWTRSEDALFTLGDSGLMCLDAAGGKERWRADLPEVAGGVSLSAGPDVLLVHATPFGRRKPKEGDQAVALDARTGKGLWKAGGTFTIISDPIHAGGNVILPTETGLIGLRARDGSEAWRFTLPGGASVEKGIHLWPVGPRLYLVVGQALVCLQSSDGKELWTISPGGWVYDLRLVDSMLVLGGETYETLLDQLNKGPLLTPGADVLRTVVAKEMPKADVAKPFTVVIDPSGPELVCAVKTGGAATVVGDRLIVAQVRFSMAFNDTTSGGTVSTSTLTAYKLDDGKISWQTKLDGSLSDVRFIGDMMYAVYTQEEKSSLVAIHLD